VAIVRLRANMMATKDGYKKSFISCNAHSLAQWRNSCRLKQASKRFRNCSPDEEVSVGDESR
jgi:hypothetical protein